MISAPLPDDFRELAPLGEIDELLGVVEEVLHLIISANLRRLEKLMSFNEVLYLMISANLRRLEKLMSFSEL